MVTESATEEEVLETYVGKLNGHVWGLSLAMIFALLLFTATNILVFKGDALHGEEVVGPHLSILAQYFFGYSVTFVGSLVGAAWALLIGYIFARLICGIYNFAARR